MHFKIECPGLIYVMIDNSDEDEAYSSTAITLSDKDEELDDKEGNDLNGGAIGIMGIVGLVLLIALYSRFRCNTKPES